MCLHFFLFWLFLMNCVLISVSFTGIRCLINTVPYHPACLSGWSVYYRHAPLAISHLCQYGDRHRKWGCRCSRGSTVRLCFPWQPSTSVTPYCENTEDGFQVFLVVGRASVFCPAFRWPWQKSKKGVIKNKCYEEPNIRWGEQSMLGRFGQR